MRKQYHFRRVGEDIHIWDVDRLVALTRDINVTRVSLSDIRELEEPYWFQHEGNAPTCRKVLEHARMVQEADPAFPIILSSDGRVMDGMHRVGKALLQGHTEIDSVQFEADPEPDFTNRKPDDLPY